jgi:hypothetical protein
MGETKMAYLYTNEETLTVAVMISLEELDTVIRILDPVADDEKHAVRHRASDLNRKFKDIRMQTVRSAIECLQHRVNDLSK